MNMGLPSNVAYHNASATRVGYSRGAPGAYGSKYNAAAAAAFTSLDACPEELLLSFHNVPYTHALKGARYGGLSVLGWINASHAAGARTAAGFVDRWRALQGQLRLAAFAVGGDSEADVFAQVTQRMQTAAADAAMFARNVTDYFARLAKAGEGGAPRQLQSGQHCRLRARRWGAPCGRHRSSL